MTQLDISDLVALREEILMSGPDVVYHTAALTNLGQCETSPHLARAINLDASSTIALACEEVGAKLVFFSTDSVFDGTKGNYREVDRPNPLNVYASSKALAEIEVARNSPRSLIIRSNFYGWGSKGKSNFGEWTVDTLRSNRQITCFKDAKNTSILVNFLAKISIDLQGSGASGVYHIGSCDPASRCDLAFGIARLFGFDQTLIARGKMAEHGFVEKRPLDISLNTDKVSQRLGVSMPSTELCLTKFKKLEEEGYRERLSIARRGS
jgi:dTDP-4-dehydrorhamnose reductase